MVQSLEGNRVTRGMFKAKNWPMARTHCLNRLGGTRWDSFWARGGGGGWKCGDGCILIFSRKLLRVKGRVDLGKKETS